MVILMSTQIIYFSQWKQKVGEALTHFLWSNNSAFYIPAINLLIEIILVQK